MDLDARTIAGGTVLEADLCVVGAGPAGITLARQFIDADLHVVVLESGAPQPDEQVQDLNEGAVAGDPYAGLRRTRYRGVGGAAHLWNTHLGGEPNAKYVPLDPCDIDHRADVPHAGWPFAYEELEPFYRHAQTVCGLGPFVYEGEYWSDPQHPCLRLDSRLTTRVYQCGSAGLFTSAYPDDVRRSGNVTLCHHATVCRLEGHDQGKRALEATVASPAGGRFRIRSKMFVLAGGAIENARLLLLSEWSGRGALGNRHGWVGRCFMEHPRDHALTLLPRTPHLFGEAAFYDAHRARGVTTVAGRIALDEQTLRTEKLPNASLTLRPRTKKRASGSGLTRVVARLRRAAARRPDMSYGWSGVRDPSSAFDAFHVLVNLEQRPHPDNRVVLARRRDRLGVPQARLHWRWRREEHADLGRLRALLASALEATGLGQVHVRRELTPDPNAHHHAGTTRMHVDPRWGVVDGNGRVHDADNVYVTGASVLPSAGFANPTLTIVALALRLADHLKRRL